jgi:hypothetical protein
MRRTRSTNGLCLAEGRGSKRSTPPRGRLALALLLSAAIAGCAAESELLHEDPGFTAATLRKDGLAVLGVVQVDEVAQVRPPLIAGLEQVLRSTRADVPLVPASRVAAALPDSAYRLLLLGYQMRGDPDSLWLAAAARAVRPMARYGVLARVESDAVRYGTRYVDETVPGQTSGREIPITGRDARITVDVYDLETRLPVFRGRFIGASDEARDFAPRRRDDADSLSAPRRPTLDTGPTSAPTFGPRPIPGPGENPADLGYPEAPPVSKAAEAAFVNFAQALPGGEAPSSGKSRR